ncbi:hypothetical protein QQ045_001922 [Rhodiola kirilowii]
MPRADASTVWKEFSTPDGKKYYYNKVTKQSKWTIPEELQLAREKAELEAGHGTQSHSANTEATTTVSTPVAAGTPNSVIKTEAMPSPVPGLAATTVELAPCSFCFFTITIVKTTLEARTDNGTLQSASTAFIGATASDIEEAKKGMPVAGKINVIPVKEKSNEPESLQYATKHVCMKAILILCSFLI